MMYNAKPAFTGSNGIAVWVARELVDPFDPNRCETMVICSPPDKFEGMSDHEIGAYVVAAKEVASGFEAMGFKVKR